MSAAPARFVPAAGADVPDGRARITAVGEVDLDRAWRDATGPHRVARAMDAHLAEVIDLDAARARRRAVRSTPARARWMLAALVAGVLAVVLAIAAVGPTYDAPAPIGPTVTVQPGQTLWEIAAAHTPDGGDVAATVAQIRDLNGLAGSTVPAWTPVVLPHVDQ